MKPLSVIFLCTVLAACGSGGPSGTLEDRACKNHMSQRARSKMANGKPELDKCLAALTALKPRVQETGYLCTTSCLQWSTADVPKAETCARNCELSHPRDGVDKDSSAFKDATLALWDRGLIGDSPSLREAVQALNRGEDEQAAKEMVEKLKAHDACEPECDGSTEKVACIDRCLKKAGF